MQGGSYGHRHNIGITRRELVQAGYSGLLGLGLASALGKPSAAGAPAPGTNGPRPRARSVVLVFLTGGPSQLETFDLKPEAPAEVRGEFQPISTKVPGIQICEHLPGFAQRMDRLAIVRSMTHKNYGHLPATHWMLTGKAMPGIPIDAGVDRIRSRSDWPCIASGVDYFRPRTDGSPTGVSLPFYLQEGPLLWPGQYAGCMGPKFDPWQINDDPNKPAFKVEGLSLPSGFAVERLQARQSLLAQVNRHQDRLSQLAETQDLDDKQKAAFSLLTTSRFGEAFRIDQEPAAVRDRYGRHRFGQALLLARRLVEAGTPVVQANMGIVQTWDSHGDLWNNFKGNLLPALDRGVGALLDDLKDRGLAEETLVIVVGEFGRSPRISTLPGSTMPGRDHHAPAFSAVFSGAGVRGGQVIGATDGTAGSPTTHAFTPDDLAATVYHSLGINPQSEFLDREGRPQQLNSGEVMTPLFTGAGV